MSTRSVFAVRNISMPRAIACLVCAACSLLASCNQASSPDDAVESTGQACPAGDEGCRCDDGRCSAGLVCASDRCVDLHGILHDAGSNANATANDRQSSEPRQPNDPSAASPKEPDASAGSESSADDDADNQPTDDTLLAQDDDLDDGTRDEADPSDPAADDPIEEESVDTDTDPSTDPVPPQDSPEAEVVAPDPAAPSESEIETAAATATPIAQGDFCSSINLLHCEAVQTCCSDDARRFADRTDCLAQSSVCPSGSALLEEPYDPAQAGLLVELYRRSTAQCIIPYPRAYLGRETRTLPETSPRPDWAESFSSGGASGGTATPPGVPSSPACACPVGATQCDPADCPGSEGWECSTTADCLGSLVCRPRDTETSDKTCEQRPAAGDPCHDTNYACTGELVCRRADDLSEVNTCESLGQLGDPCFDQDHCVNDYWCRATELEPTHRHCEDPAPEGGYCSRNAHCQAGLSCVGGLCGSCSGHAQCGRWSNADGTFTHEVCVTGVCQNADAVSGVLVDGAACFSSRHCQSGWCSSGTCLTPTADEIYCRPPQ